MKRLIVYILCLCALLSAPARAQSILRDAETERFLRDITDPLLLAAGLEPSSITIFLIGDSSINAFAAGGRYIGVHSGMILANDNVNELIGVLAHETCHIACQHSLRTRGAIQNAGITSILSMVLGAAAIAAGGGDAGIGLISAGQQAAQRQFLAYSRGQESEADIAGARYLEAVGVSPAGLISFFDKLRDQEILAQIRQDPYVRSHPINRTRILQLQDALERSPHKDKPPDVILSERFERIKAKLFGYISDPVQTLRTYPVSDISIAARYARVYGYHKALEWDLALEEADALIAAEPENPYFHEIKGQILFENGKVREALPVLERAVELAPNQPLIITALGQALVSTEDEDMMARAQPVLEEATRLDRGNTFAWFNLAKTYSWQGKEAHANLATAERFYAAGYAGRAAHHARMAVEAFDRGSPEWLRAQDILAAAGPVLQQQRGRRR